jgi:hypothetical protein
MNPLDSSRTESSISPTTLTKILDYTKIDTQLFLLKMCTNALARTTQFPKLWRKHLDELPDFELVYWLQQLFSSETFEGTNHS